MPIEFRCTQCGKLLRTPDETAGKRAKCPDCAAILAIPAAPTGPGPAADAPSPSPSGGDGGSFGPPPADPGSPFAPAPSGGQPGSPFGAGGPQTPGQPNPYQSPAPYAAPGGGPYGPAPGAFGPRKIDFGDIFNRTWKIFGDQWALCLGVSLVATVLMLGAFGLVMAGAALIGEITNEEALVGAVFLVGGVAGGVFAMWIGVGQMLFYLKVARGEQANISDLFTGGPYLVTVLGASILVAIIVMVGMMLCYVPGIIFALMLSQYLYLILDRKVGVMESLSLSKDITEGNKLTLFLLQLVVQLVANVLVYVTCGLGMLALVPFMGVMNAVIYLAMTGQPTAEGQPMPYPQPQGPVPPQ